MTTFETSEGLRHLLDRFAKAGHGAWSTDPEAAELMVFTIQKYRSLAQKHHCQPEDSAAAAFEVMRTDAVRRAHDPWAVVTRAVQVTLIAEERANGLLCSPAQARRTQISCHHDARRFSDSEATLLDFHPALRADLSAPAAPTRSPDLPTGAFEAVDQAIALFVALGWPLNTATCALDYIAARLIECGNRATTHAMLRRDHSARALLDLDRPPWATLLRLTLGAQSPGLKSTYAGHGILLQLLIGDSVTDLLSDDELILEISQAAPRAVRRVEVA